MSDQIKFEDPGFPGDELIAKREGEVISIRCIETNDGDACALVDLTHTQARQFAEWIMEVTA